MNTHSTSAGRKRQRRVLTPNREDLEEKRLSEPRPKVRRAESRGRTEGRKRQADLLRQERAKRLRLRGLCEELGRTVRRRRRLVSFYLQAKQYRCEAEAATRTARRYGLSESSVRRWAGIYKKRGMAGLAPPLPVMRCTRIQTPWHLQVLVASLRRLYGWNEKRLAAELEQRAIAHIGHSTVGRIFRHFHLPTRTYHPCAKRHGICQQRYEKEQVNVQWHLDFTQVMRDNGQTEVVGALVDDASRYCLWCGVLADQKAQTALRLIVQVLDDYTTHPQGIVTDNGRAFISVHCGVPTAFGLGLKERGITHRLTSFYYPEGNGKVEAFIKIVKHEGIPHPPVSLHELQERLTAFQTYYNFYRLHGSLGWQTPASRYWGLTSPRHHGLAGIPELPPALFQAFPPATNFVPPSTDIAALRRHLALVTLNS